jgi:ribonuclease R
VGLLRSLKRARYSPESLGHFGLAKSHYTHFTSPIRRYADLLVHRSLFGVRDTRLTASTLAHTADHISETERRSSDAEQDSKQIKLMTFLQDQITSRKLNRYEAIVHEMRRSGFFVEVKDLGLRGMVLLRDCKDDYYEWIPSRHAFVGKRHKRNIRMGDTIEVIAARVDPQRRLVDFTLA